MWNFFTSSQLPFKKKGGRQRVYYHIKDVSFLAHEPLLHKFRQMKSFMKKFKKRVGRNETSDASKLWDERPQYTLNHLVRERYPQFGDAVRDLDDALCLVYLFAQLPAKRAIKVETTDACRKLVREWETYVTHSGSLKKVFVSIKGTYYQARVHNEDVTWLVPHKFNIRLPREVDFTLMGWFLDFYQVALKFIMFRLYNGLGLRYPPVLDDDLEAQGAHLAALTVKPRRKGEVPTPAPAQPATGFGDDEDSTNDILAKRMAARAAERERHQHSKDKLSSLQLKLSALPAEQGAEAVGKAASASVSPAISSAASSSVSSSSSGIARPAEASTLFSGLKIFLSREVPRESLEMCILACGGQVGWDGMGSPIRDESDQTVTHSVVDRTVLPPGQVRHATREYVQPQWIYDCINAQMILPVTRYSMGSELPPHLSPFVDDRAEGYIPQYREELDQLKAANESNAAAAMQDDSDSDDDDGEGGATGASASVAATHVMENKYALELAAEASGVSYSEFARGKKKGSGVGAGGSDSEDNSEDNSEGGNSDTNDDDNDEDDAEEAEAARKEAARKQSKQKKAEEHRERQLAVMSKKRKRLYNRMQHGIKAKQAVTDNLMKKRHAAEEASDEQQHHKKKKKKPKKKRD